MTERRAQSRDTRLTREHRLAWMLCVPAVAAMLLVTAWPMLYAAWLSLFRHDLRFPAEREFVGLDNYLAVLGSEAWWQALSNTFVITAASVAIELVLGFAFALVMHHTLVARRLVRTALLVPYGIVTVVAAMSWRLAFDPVTGFVDGLVNLEDAWLAELWSAFFVIVQTEVWKTTPFMALLLLAGLTLVSDDSLRAARVDGANALQRFLYITLPQMRTVIIVALLFRTLDAFRIFDTVFIQTRGAHDTASVSVVGYDTLVTRLNLGLGSAVSVLIFGCVVMIAVAFIRLGRLEAGRGARTGR